MRKRLQIFLVFVVTLAVAVSWWLLPERYELVVRGGTVVDGTGAAPHRGSVCVRAQRIVPCAMVRRLAGLDELNARGKIVAPGFIDVHTHIERAFPTAPGRKIAAWNFINQGVTSVITGNCGTSVLDLAAVAKRIDGGIQVNVASFVGHNSLRTQVLGRAAGRRATLAEVDSMQRLVRRAMRDGALGASLGLGYFSGSFADRAEIIALGKAAARDSGMLNFHIRDEGVDGVDALNEALEEIKRAKVRGHISHFKAAGRSQWGTVKTRLKLLASTPGIGVDVYPYEASSTDLSPIMPKWALALTPGELKRTLKDPKRRATLRDDMRDILRRTGWKDYAFVQVASFWPQRDYDGRFIPEIAQSRSDGADVSGAEQADLLVSMLERGGAQLIYHEMSAADVDSVVLWTQTSIGSDAAIRTAEMDARPHPRGMGTFPKIFARYVRTGLMTLPEAVHRMTGLPAREFRLRDRGTLLTGNWADIVVFDLETVQDVATYEDPLVPPDGIIHVVVNGVAVIKDASETKRYPGRFLRRGRS